VDIRSHQLLLELATYHGLNMTIKDKAKKVVTKVDEVIAIADPVSDRFLDLIKNSKRTVLVILIIGFIIWLI
jgi:hypothetical protein